MVAAEARGFILGAALARELSAGFVPARKPGKLPHETISAEYILEYGVDALEMHADALADGARVLLHDDLLATGGTARALAELVEGAGGQIAGCGFLVELAFLDGRGEARALRRARADHLRRRVTARRSRTIDAPRSLVWALVAEPRRLPAWWPRTERVESVGDDEWTSVLRSPRGNTVRADFRVEASEPERRRAWAQQLEGSPFERLLAEHVTTVELAEAADGGTAVTLEVRQRARGWARFGGFLLRRAVRRQLDEALAGLAGALE